MCHIPTLALTGIECEHVCLTVTVWGRFIFEPNSRGASNSSVHVLFSFIRVLFWLLLDLDLDKSLSIYMCPARGKVCVCVCVHLRLSLHFPFAVSIQ